MMRFGCCKVKILEFIDTFLATFNSFPLLSKVGLFGCMIVFAGILAFSPREAEKTDPDEDAPPVSETGPAEIDPATASYLEIGDIRVFPQTEMVVRVEAHINSTTYRHPRIGGVQWLQVGPEMTKQTLQLPKSDDYTVRFEAFTKFPDEDGEGRLSSSQEVVVIERVPFEGTYRLYSVSGATRAAGASVEIDYRLYQ